MAKGDRLLQSARDSQVGWNPEKLKRLYRAYGFHISPGGKHDIIEHPDYPLSTTLPRHKPVLKVYVQIAVELIDNLNVLKKRDK